MDIPHFLTHSLVDHLSCFHFLDIMNNIALNIHIQVFVWAYVFISLEYISGVELLSQILILCLSVWHTAENSFPK